jgi:uncharacterized membrane protein YwzB
MLYDNLTNLMSFLEVAVAVGLAYFTVDLFNYRERIEKLFANFFTNANEYLGSKGVERDTLLTLAIKKLHDFRDDGGGSVFLKKNNPKRINIIIIVSSILCAIELFVLGLIEIKIDTILYPLFIIPPIINTIMPPLIIIREHRIYIMYESFINESLGFIKAAYGDEIRKRFQL